MKIEVSLPQMRVLKLLLDHKDGYALKHKFYHFQEVVLPNIDRNTYHPYFTRPTLEVLIEKGVLIHLSGIKYGIREGLTLSDLKLRDHKKKKVTQ